MPDVREVYEMVTKQKPPEPGALERQRQRQVRTARNRKLGAFVVAAAVCLVAVALFLSSRTGGSAPAPAVVPSSSTLDLPTPQGPTGEADAEQIVRDFLFAYGVFDAKEAMRHVADDADLSGLIEQAPANERGLALWLSFLEAQEFEHTITSCLTNPTPTTDISVVCDFDFHMIRSQELDRGPFTGSTYTFTVRDGAVVRADLAWNIDEFSPQMWEPFAHWVNITHPKAFDVMFNDDGTNFELTTRSVRLWGVNSTRYVKAVQGGDAE